jgi:hypothetical protein
VPDKPQFTRRTALRLLVIGALTAVTGCRPTRARSAPTATVTAGTTASRLSPTAGATRAPETAVEQLVTRVAAAERALLAAYDTASSKHPELAARLSPLRADHAAHLHGLLPGAVIPKPTPPPSPSASSSVPAPAMSGAPLPASASPTSDQTLSELAALERAAAAARVDDVLASSGSLARVLASIGGCEAAHAALLAVGA